MTATKTVVEIPSNDWDKLMTKLDRFENELATKIIEKINQEFINKNDLLSELDLANYLGKHKKTIAGWRVSGKIKPFYVAEHPYYRLSDIIEKD